MVAYPLHINYSYLRLVAVLEVAFQSYEILLLYNKWKAVVVYFDLEAISQAFTNAVLTIAIVLHCKLMLKVSNKPK